MHDQVRERGRGAPGRLLGFDPVRAWLLGGLGWGRDGVEAQRQLLVNAAVGVEQNMGGVAVDPESPVSTMITPDSSATSRITAWAADSPTSRRPPGNSQ